jgi:hypothetical protein
MTVLTRGVSSASVILICAAALAGCGSSSTPAGGAATTSAAPRATTSQSPGQSGAPGGFDPAIIQQAQKCLKAAGITVPSAPSGAPGGDFTPGAGGTPPSGGTGGPGGGAGGGGFFNTPEAKAALKACGITIPTNPGRVDSQ